MYIFRYTNVNTYTRKKKNNQIKLHLCCALSISAVKCIFTISLYTYCIYTEEILYIV